MLRNWLLKSHMARHLAVWNPEQERDILVDTGGPRSEGGYDSESVPSPTQVGAPREGLSDTASHRILPLWFLRKWDPRFHLSERSPLHKPFCALVVSNTALSTCAAMLFLPLNPQEPCYSPGRIPMVPYPWWAVCLVNHPNFIGLWLCIPSGLYPMGFVITD